MSICLSVALALWVGGLALMMWVVAPVSFRKLGKEEAVRTVGLLFPAVDRWCLVWGMVACAALLGVFLRRHFEPRSLVLELPVAAMFLLTLHLVLNLHPQIRDLRGKLALPEYQGTAREERIRFLFQRLHRRSVRLHAVVLALGLFSLGLLPSFLP